MDVWVYRSYGGLQKVICDEMTSEVFASKWSEYFPEDIYFFAELVSL